MTIHRGEDYWYCAECDHTQKCGSQTTRCELCGGKLLSDGEMRDIVENEGSSSHWPRTWGDL